jgi:multiple sugar transport system permease protein
MAPGADERKDRDLAMKTKKRGSAFRDASRKRGAARAKKTAHRATSRPSRPQHPARAAPGAGVTAAAMEPSAAWKAGSRRSRLSKSIRSIIITGFTTVLLILFLIPFAYMVTTSLKTQAQFAFSNAPLWPVLPPAWEYTGGNTGTYTVMVSKASIPVEEAVNLNDYVGKSLEVYTVPLEAGSKNLALLKGFQKGSIFLDPENVAAGPIAWNGGSFKALQRPWVFHPAWSNYVDMWNAIDYPRVLWNTFYYTFTTTIGVLISCVLVAFGFSRFRFPFRDILFMILISIMFLPGTVTVIPTFLFWTQIGLVGSWLPLIIPAFFANPYDTFLLRQFFMTLPRELDESAMIDGANPLQILWSVIIPQSYPVIIAVTVFHIVYAWNDYFGPLIYLSTQLNMQPISVALARFNSMYGQHPELIQAGALVTLIPPLILFAAAQRFFVQGIVITGVEK